MSGQGHSKSERGFWKTKPPLTAWDEHSCENPKQQTGQAQTTQSQSQTQLRADRLQESKGLRGREGASGTGKAHGPGEECRACLLSSRKRWSQGQREAPGAEVVA